MLSYFARPPDTNIKNSQYQYTALDPGKEQIRLLKIEGPNSLQISIFDLENLPPFHALSYVWGTSTESTIWNIQGQRLSVRSNATRFLQHYLALSDDRYREKFPEMTGKAAGPRDAYIWIDQLCINQEDTLERHSQVAMMRDIYRHAIGAVSWPSTSEEEMELIEQALRRYRVEPGKHGIIRGDDRVSIFPRTFDAAEIALVSAAYWNRVWIQQEIVVPSHVRIFSGSETLDWKDFKLDFCSWMYPKEASFARPLKRVIELDDHTPFYVQNAMFGELGLVTRLRHFEHCGASDKRDRLYAILHFIVPEERLEVDYSKTSDELWWLIIRKAVIEVHLSSKKVGVPMRELEKLLGTRVERGFGTDYEQYRKLIREFVKNFWTAWSADMSLTIEKFEKGHRTPYARWKEWKENRGLFAWIVPASDASYQLRRHLFVTIAATCLLSSDIGMIGRVVVLQLVVLYLLHCMITFSLAM